MMIISVGYTGISFSASGLLNK